MAGQSHYLKNTYHYFFFSYVVAVILATPDVFTSDQLFWTKFLMSDVLVVVSFISAPSK